MKVSSNILSSFLPLDIACNIDNEIPGLLEGERKNARSDIDTIPIKFSFPCLPTLFTIGSL